jgi:hypothetical protein
VQLARPVARVGRARVQRAPREHVDVERRQVVEHRTVDAAVDVDDAADRGRRVRPSFLLVLVQGVLCVRVGFCCVCTPPRRPKAAMRARAAAAALYFDMPRDPYNIAHLAEGAAPPVNGNENSTGVSAAAAGSILGPFSSNGLGDYLSPSFPFPRIYDWCEDKYRMYQFTYRQGSSYIRTALCDNGVPPRFFRAGGCASDDGTHPTASLLLGGCPIAKNRGMNTYYT